MKHVYTITSGYLEIDNKQCNIPFALIFENEGVLFIESFLEKSDFYDSVKGLNYYRLVGKTEKGYDIECEGLFFTQYQYKNQKIKFICENFIKLINNQDKGPKIENSIPVETPIYFAEIEGLKMHFADHTETEQYRNSGKVENLLNVEFDHTDCAFLFNHPDFNGNQHKIVFYKNTENENLLIDFRSPEGYSTLTYKKYLIIRNDLLQFLSFINGAQVKLRKELLGETLTIKSANKGFDAQTVCIYSFKKELGFNCNDYLPIDNYHSHTNEIFHKAFLFGFDKFYHLNKQFDFNRLIFSLNATNDVGLDERFFILITALERLSKNYANNNPDESKHLIDDDFFKNTIKPELTNHIKKYKSDITNFKKGAWDVFNSKIGNLNRRNKSETSQKLYELLNYANITISDSVVNLVENERNEAVHEGIIGQDDTARIKNYWKLDHILRDIVLNLIEYKGIRKRKFEYEKE
jgi:hypothetical protein